MRDLFRRIRRGYHDFYHTEQLKSFFTWLISQPSSGDELAYLRLPHQEEFRACSSGTRRVYDKGDSISFVICEPGGLERSLQKLSEKNNLEKPWFLVFHSPAIEIWENKARHRGALPLRFGLSNEEKNFVLTRARRTLGTYLRTGECNMALPEDAPERFLEKASVDVALWVDGTLRGSRIVENLPLISAIDEAAIRSCRDERFKPLSSDELNAARIEIAILSDLRMPLSDREIRGNIIASEKGYLVAVQGKRGWFLPTVLNCVTFKNLNDFLTRLIEEKAGVPRAFLSAASVRVFEVDNFIESKQPSRKALSLLGPVVRSSLGLADFRQEIDGIAVRGADFLCRLQETDGNIPPSINPLTGKSTQIDWVRLAFTASALALMGKVNASSEYEGAARKSLAYITRHIYTHPYLSREVRCLAFVYAHKLADVLGEVTEARKMHAAMLELLPSIPYEPIRYSQLARHLFEYGRGDAALFAKAVELSSAVLNDYERRIRSGTIFELARFPELIPMLRIIGDIRNSQEMIRKSEDISRWYVSQQLPDGSFPSSVGSTFSYVRGSGKIFEVLCLEPAQNRKCIERTVRWLSDMQYNENNTYFVEERVKGNILGGFRHDAVNQAVWIDATGHVLLAAARLKAVR